MRWVAGSIGILGALAGLTLGGIWFWDWSSTGHDTAALAVMLVPGIKTATYLLLLGGVVGLVVSVLILRRRANRWLNALLLMVCGVLPILFYVKALWGAPMTLAGLLALAVRYDKAVNVPKD
jgi:hypothetical protein